MSNIEKIRQEIEFLKELNEGLYTEGGNSYYEGQDNAYNHILVFIDSLPEETCKDSLQVHETCKENTDSFTSLEEAAQEYAIPFNDTTYGCEYSYKGFIAGAKWQAKQLLKSSPLPEDTVLFKKGVEEGRRLERDDLALTWQDIRRIVKIADDLLDDPKARVAFQNHNEEYYYKRVLDEYNKLH